MDNTETKISDISEDYLNAYKLLLLYKIKDLKQPNAEDIKNLALYYGSNYIFAYNYNVTEHLNTVKRYLEIIYPYIVLTWIN